MSINAQQLTETIIATKHLLRSQLPGYASVFTEVEGHIRREVETIQNMCAHGEAVIPELDYAVIAAGRVSAAQKREIKRRGAVVVRRVFTRAQATAWNEELGEYLLRNGYYVTELDPTLDQYFTTLESARPQIFGIYWSRPQVLARQAESMTKSLRLPACIFRRLARVRSVRRRLSRRS